MNTDEIVALRSAAFAYPRTHRDVVSNLSFTIGSGDRVAITGPSGAGKSTLLNILGLLDPIRAGEHRLRGQDVRRLRAAARADLRARHIGFVFQAFHLLPGLTAADNVLMGSRYSSDATAVARREEAESLLAKVGLSNYHEALPLELSGGQQQRVAIARALAGSPVLVLCDEPTGNLDATNAGNVLQVLAESIDDKAALVVVTHDELVAARMERRLRITDSGASWE